MEEVNFGTSRPAVDLREILEITANTVAIMGLVLNAFLVYLIFYKTTKLLADYKIILIQNCMIDIFFTVINDVTKVVSLSLCPFNPK